MPADEFIATAHPSEPQIRSPRTSTFLSSKSRLARDLGDRPIT